MPDGKKQTKWLLVGVPDDIIDLVRDYQAQEVKRCNCRFGVLKSIVSLLRKAYPDRKYCSLQDAGTKKIENCPVCGNKLESYGLGMACLECQIFIHFDTGEISRFNKQNVIIKTGQTDVKS